GACGYENTIKQGYGLQTAALSTALFNDGAACGACFEIYCTNDPQWCKKPAVSIKITATNFCPPNYTKTVDVWCNPPQKHFDLTLPMFLQIAYYKAGVVPVSYRRIPGWRRCRREGEGFEDGLDSHAEELGTELVYVDAAEGAGAVVSMVGWEPARATFYGGPNGEETLRIEEDELDSHAEELGAELVYVDAFEGAGAVVSGDH
ncbi:hypothetical protein C3L33_00901, partial [Rhododendron williamsianum]